VAKIRHFSILFLKKEVAQPTSSRGDFLKIATFPGILFFKIAEKIGAFGQICSFLL
jgi:hypothetical protein